MRQRLLTTAGTAFLAAFVGLAACSSPSSDLSSREAYSCFRDNDCAEGMVCFADGCADPGEDIVVEVTPAAAKGVHAQDFAFDRVSSTLDFNVTSASVLKGELQMSTGSGVSPYSAAVAVRCTGESNLIPGQVRRFETSAVQTGGTYEFPVASGRYTVIATPTEVTVPPVVAQGAVVAPGEAKVLSFVFPSNSDVLTLSAQLVKTAGPPMAPMPSDLVMEVSAVHPSTGQPLSQRIEVGGDGQFTLVISPEAKGLSTFQLRASPKPLNLLSGQVPVPSKVFTISATALPPLFELGAYGAPVTVSGQLRTEDGAPLAGATVSVEGPVTGGGTFRSASVKTNSDGVFQLTTLPNPADARAVLVAVPVSTSDAGILQLEIDASAGAPLTLGALTAPRKVPVRGRVVTFEGNSAGLVRVRAVPLQAAAPALALPQGAETLTDGGGNYELKLDPTALYRLDYIPTFGNTPRASRFVALQRDVSLQEERLRPEELPELSLSRGRRVSGTVRSVQSRAAGDVTTTPYAQVSFFRRVSIDGKASALLLAEGTTDASGRYEVLLPSR